MLMLAATPRSPLLSPVVSEALCNHQQVLCERLCFLSSVSMFHNLGVVGDNSPRLARLNAPFHQTSNLENINRTRQQDR